MMQGTDLDWFRRLRAATDLEITAAGGITTLDDIRALDALAIHSAVGHGHLHGPPESGRTGALVIRKYTGAVPALTFLEARSLVLRHAGAAAPPPMEHIPLLQCLGRVLAQDAPADRDYPPFNRSARDGFAVRALDLPGEFRVIGEVRAGESFPGTVGRGEAVEIMTGAPVPHGADAVVMVENAESAVRNDDRIVSMGESLAAGANISEAGCEARAGEVPLARGTRLDYTAIAWLAATGQATVAVYKKPRVAILPTGDEIVPVEDKPAAYQIRNSNAYSLAVQVARAGGEPVLLPVAPDTLDATRKLIEKGLEADLLLLSGGVSAGKYDVVEPALAQLGAEFFFDRVLIQPGAPTVFGKVRDKFFFGLPGNPASTMLVFEVLARAALDPISGAKEAPLPLTLARLTRPFRHKGGSDTFPACLRQLRRSHTCRLEGFRRCGFPLPLPTPSWWPTLKSSNTPWEIRFR